MSQVTFEEIRVFTISQLWSIKGEVTENTCLAHDFGVAGLDGKEYMESFSKQFSVPLDGFDWIDYFGPESSGSPLSLICYLYNRVIKRIPARTLVDLPELSLGHLVNCAKLGHWTPP